MLRALLDRFLPHRSPGVAATWSTALVTVYARAGHLFMEASHRTRAREAGYWIASGEIVVLPAEIDEERIGTAVLAALASSRLEVPVPTRGTRLETGLFRAMGVRSRRAAMTGTLACVVTREPATDGGLRIEPLRNGGSSGERRGYSFVPHHAVHLARDASATDLGLAIRGALHSAATQR